MRTVELEFLVVGVAVGHDDLRINGLWFAKRDQRVDGDDAVGRADQRVDVEFGDAVGLVGREFRQPADDLRESIDVDGLTAAETREQRRSFQPQQHRTRFSLRHGRKFDGGVLEQFDHRAAEARHDQRAELRVDARADHDFDARGNHRLHEHAGDARWRRDLSRIRHDRLVGLPHRRGVAQVQFARRRLRSCAAGPAIRP